MTLEEAKDILLKLENLVAKTNRLYKKGERMDSMSFIKLHRKRISMFEVQEEAECIVREGDLEFYRAWADRVLDKPTNYNFIHFRQEIEQLNETIQNAIQKKEKGEIHTFFIDTPSTMKVVHHDLDNPDWREAVLHSPYFTHEQRDFLLQKSYLLLSFYQLFEEWTDTLRSVPEEIVNVDKYIQNAFRILWVLPSELPGQKASLHTMMKEHPTWEEFPCKLYSYSKMFFVSFVIQQLYYYRYDKESLLSYSNLCRHASIVDWYDSLQRTAIVHLNHASAREMKDIVCRLQPNVILTPGTFSSVLSALGWNNDDENLRLLTGSSMVQGIASCHCLHDITFVQTPILTDGTISVEEYMTDVCSLMRYLYANNKQPLSIPLEVKTEIDETTYLYDTIKEAIELHCYVDAQYPDVESGTYQSIHFLPCLLKKHNGNWYVIGKHTDGTFQPYYLDSLHYIRFTEAKEEVPESLLLPYRYAYGVHLCTDIHLNPNLVTDGAELFVIRIRVHAPLWKEFILYPLHFTQDLVPPTKEDGDSRVFQYKMYITDELIHLFRGYGKQLEVLLPEVLQRELV